jgi:hypothetical protein
LSINALEKGRNVLVDGSLRNGEWYLQYFKDLRKTFPSVRIAIIHVCADMNQVLYRAKQRALVTGRVVPEEVS